MSWIGNYSFEAICKGHHALDPGRTVLIRIADRDTWFRDEDVFHFNSFVDVHRLNFQDNEDLDDGAMNEEQAEFLASILTLALEYNKNIVVHCAAGLCRSGAVTEAGVILGFQDAETHRIPNLHVKKLLLRKLNLLNSWDDDAEKDRVQELTAKHFFTTTGGILVPKDD